MVFPQAVDLEESFGKAFVAQFEFFDDAQTVRVARNDAHFDAVQM